MCFDDDFWTQGTEAGMPLRTMPLTNTMGCMGYQSYQSETHLRLSVAHCSSYLWYFDGNLLKTVNDESKCLAYIPGAIQPQMETCNKTHTNQQWETRGETMQLYTKNNTKKCLTEEDKYVYMRDCTENQERQKWYFD